MQHTSPVHALAAALGLLSEIINREPPPTSTVNVEDVATLLDTTPRGVYALYATGKLPRSIGPGRRLLWHRDELVEWLRKRALSPGRTRR